jgi:Uma2 family endonuclease
MSTDLGDPPLVLQLQPVVQLSDEQFFELAQLNRDLRVERTARGELILALPTGGETGQRNSEITMQLALWAKADGRGITFDSSTGFHLPNAAVRSPDASWVAKARLAALTDEQRQKFLPLCPDFVIELRSPADRLSVLREKMQEYLDNGAQLGLLLDPEQRRVYVYRAGAEVEELTGPETVSAEPVLPGFALDLREIW